MRIERELERLDIAALRRPSELTDTARQALVSLCTSIGQLRFLAPDSPVLAAFPCRELLEQLVDTILPAEDATTLLLANDAVYARTLFLSDQRYDYVLDRTFEYLDTVLGLIEASTPNHAGLHEASAPAHIDLQTATLISHLFSTISLSAEDAAPYLSALRAYIETALPHLEAALLPLATNPSANTESLTEAFTESSMEFSAESLTESSLVALLEQMDTVSLIFESSFLFQSAYRLRALPLHDILRRRTISILSDLGQATHSRPLSTHSRPLSTHSRLLAAYSRLLVSDLEAGPNTYHTLLATLATEALDILAPHGGPAPRLPLLSVLASATIAHLSAREDETIYSPFE